MKKGFAQIIILTVILLTLGSVTTFTLLKPSFFNTKPIKTETRMQDETLTKPQEVVPVREELEEINLIPGKTFLLKDNKTELALRNVHKYTWTQGGVFVENGLPYVKVEDGWLEIINSATIASNEYDFQIDKLSCNVQRKSREDYVYFSLESCTLRVKTMSSSTPKVAVTTFQRNISLGDRYDKLLSTTEQNQLLAVRSLGFAIGNVNREIKPWVVESINSGLDVVTNFGVKNLDFDYYKDKPIIGSERTFALGPQQVTLKILDVANSNTRCNPSCRDVFDLNVSINPSTSKDGQVKILRYN